MGARQAKALGAVVGEKCDLEVLLSDLKEKLEGALASSAASRQQVFHAFLTMPRGRHGSTGTIFQHGL